MRYYSYNQSSKYGTSYPMQRSEKSNCLGAFISALITVAVGVMTFFVIYYGWVTLVRPLLHAWSTMLVVGG